MKLKLLLTAAAFAAVSSGAALATTLSGSLGADNLFSAYLSTDDSVLGTPLLSGVGWDPAFAIPATALTPGVTNYLHVVAQDTGLVFEFDGALDLSDTNFHFLNGGQHLLTNTSDWKANIYGGTWTAPAGTPVDEGTNGFCCTPWSTSTLPTFTTFIWAAGGYSGSAAEFSTPILTDVARAPEPATWAMMLAGVLGIGTLLRASRRRGAAGLSTPV